VSRCQKRSSGLRGARGDIRGRCIPTICPAGRHSIWSSQRPTSLIPPFLCRMPFLPQPSQFILAWNRHQICWLAYPLAWFLLQVNLWGMWHRFWVSGCPSCHPTISDTALKEIESTDPSQWQHLSRPSATRLLKKGVAAVMYALQSQYQTRDLRFFLWNKPHAGCQRGQKMPFLSLVTLTFDLHIQTPPSKERSTFSV